jgi:hypothetical protein
MEILVGLVTMEVKDLSCQLLGAVRLTLGIAAVCRGRKYVLGTMALSSNR